MSTRYISVEVNAAAKTIMIREASPEEQERAFPLYPIDSGKHIFRIQQQANNAPFFPQPGGGGAPIVGGLNDLFGHLVFVTLDDGALLEERERVIQNSYQARATAQDFSRELQEPTVIIQADSAREVPDRQIHAVLTAALKIYKQARVQPDPAVSPPAIACDVATDLMVVIDHTANILLIRSSSAGRSNSIPVQLGL